MTTTVDIKGVDKVKLLHEMWKSVKPAAFFASYPGMIPKFDEDKARMAVGQYIDYFDGKVHKDRHLRRSRRSHVLRSRRG
jgi:hypothetical protein